jgi:hypothetical protein
MIPNALRQLEDSTSWACPERWRLGGFRSNESGKSGTKGEEQTMNTSETEPLVTLRYFGPEVNPDAPAMGAYRKNKFN